MKILVIHHLESEWEHGYNRMGTSFEELAEKVIDHLEENDYDRVILTRFENHQLGDEHYLSGLSEWIDQVEVYGYGWERSMIEDYPETKWVEGGSHSEIVLIEEWIEQLVRHEVSLCGAFDGECIEDMEIALGGVDVPFNRINSLIV